MFGTEFCSTNIKKVTMKGLGDKIRILRYKKGWSQEILAQKLGVSIFVLSQIENDKVDLYYVLLVKMAQLFNVPVYALLSIDNNVELKPTELEQLEQQISQYDDYIVDLRENIVDLKEQLPK